MANENEVNININVRREGENAEAPAKVKVSRAKTSRYKDYAELEVDAGQSIGQVRSAHFHDLDLDEGLTAVVNGAAKGDDYVLRAGDALRFNPAPKDRGC